MVASRPSDTFQPGEVLNSTYRIEEILGRGGTSEVYKAKSEISGRYVALKVLSAQFSNNEDYLVLMKREEEIRDVRHDAVVRYSEISRTPDGHVYLTMDYLDGPSLEDKLKQGGMSADDLLAVAARVAEGLIATHARNIIHRDLSPDNILLRNNRPDEAVIIDFGIARDTNPGAATIVGGEFAGKYAYAAPEQLRGDSGARSDIYSLGALLLATFRGKRPDVGRNPLEVIEGKKVPLDVSGVPEPLGSLIAKMTQPDPEDRFQSAQELLAEVHPQYHGTVIGTPVSEVSRLNRREPAAQAQPRKTGGGGALKAIAAVAVLAAIGAGLYFGRVLDPILGPRLPVASPYVLFAQGGASVPPVFNGNVPDADLMDDLQERAAAGGGSADVVVATGDIVQNWGDGVEFVIDAVSGLREWSVSADGNFIQIAGRAETDAEREAIENSLEGAPLLAGMTVDSRILSEPPALAFDVVENILKREADCGPLTQIDPPLQGYASGAPIEIRGRLSDARVRDRLFQSLTAAAGDRPVMIDADVVGQESCLMDVMLGSFQSGGIDIRFREGASGAAVENGRFRPGQNPVIDVVIPDEIRDGFLWVSIVDLSGEVYHLLPNNSRPDNSVATLRGGADGPVAVPVTYSIADAAGYPARVAFQVDDREGTSRIVTIHSLSPLFSEPRPLSESLAGFAEAMIEEINSGRSDIRSVQSREIVTVR